MRVFSVSANDPDRFEETELPEPTPEGRDLLVRVKAVSLNPVDTKVRKRRGGRVLGWDCAGEVVAVGSEVSAFKPGDAVYYAGDVRREGTNAQRHLVHEAIVGRKPQSLDWLNAAAIPLTALTAWEGLYEQLRVEKGRTLLIINSAGGVGSMVTQLAKRLSQLRVIGTASRPESREWARKMGVDAVVNHREDLPTQLEAQGLKHVDYIFCCHDTAHHFEAMAQLIAPQGHIVSIVETDTMLPLGKIFTKKASFSWEFMFTKSMHETANMSTQQDILNQCAALFDKETLRSTLTEDGGELTAEKLTEAHKRLESGRMIGKLAFSLPEEE